MSTVGAQMLNRSIFRRSLLFTTVFTASFFTALLPCKGQVLYGTLTGNVTDASGGAVPGVHVEAVNQGTNDKKEGEADEHGVYRFTDLQPGMYQITVTSPSFSAFHETDIQVQPGTVRRVDVQLQIAATSRNGIGLCRGSSAPNRQRRYSYGNYEHGSGEAALQRHRRKELSIAFASATRGNDDCW